MDSKEEWICLRVEVRGIVQGVGFRPFVYNLAQKMGLQGCVYNSSRGAVVELEGPRGKVRQCVRDMQDHVPLPARVTEVLARRCPTRGYTTFQIVGSSQQGEKEALVPPDMAVCGDCRREVMAPGSRRHRYPFTNCTGCGPRFTIISGVPYDRERTAMSGFAMCPACQGEYDNPRDRRFHAQPNACPRCGPRVTLVDREGKEVPGHWEESFRQIIRRGGIVAVKGLGGFHLACDARNGEAVQLLRQRKHRPHKPFAVMCRDPDVAAKYCRVSREEARWLASPEAPIVILKKLAGTFLPPVLAPNVKTLGVMLPYTPLHMLLFDDELEFLVMTSGNLSGLPLVKDDGLALEQLGGVADYFLLHNRPVLQACDDSLLRVVEEQPFLYRRSRGFVPRPLMVPPGPPEMVVLGAGGEMKNTFCLLQGERAFLSQHLGEMDFQENLDHFQAVLAGFQQLFNLKPQFIAYDMHPHYRISALARTLPARVQVPVQHHHAHMAACMADNGLDEKVVGVVCDGTGFGTDGCVWGMEILTGDYQGFERCLHLAYLPMPGGESAVRKPWRMAVAYLYQYLGRQGLELAPVLFPGRDRELEITVHMLEQRLNSPLTSSCGRLFDAVSALLGVCRESTYEGQAAVELGELVEPGIREEYPFNIANGVMDPGPMLREIVHDVQSGQRAGVIATAFHNTVSAMLTRAAGQAGRQAGLHKAVLTGGSFQNACLFQGVTQGLQREGFQVYSHRQVPCNDGGLALGQAMIAARSPGGR